MNEQPKLGSAGMAEQMLKRNLLLLAQKLKDGKALTAAELALVQAAVPAPKDEAATWAKNQVQLANELGVERKTVQRWLKEDGNPGARENGNYNVKEWREWAALNGRKSGDIPTQTELRAENLILQNKKLERQLRILDREFVPVAEVEELGARLGAALRKVVATLHLVAPSLVDCPLAEIDQILREKEDELIGQLHLLDVGLDTMKTAVDATDVSEFAEGDE